MGLTAEDLQRRRRSDSDQGLGDGLTEVGYQKKIEEAIWQNPIFRQTMAVMEDPEIDRLLARLWQSWRQEVSLPGANKVMPLNPWEFAVGYPPHEKLPYFDQWEDPITAYLHSISLNRIEDEIWRVLPVVDKLVWSGGATGEGRIDCDRNSFPRYERLGKVYTLREYFPAYGGAHCGVIRLETPFEIKGGNKLLIRVGYDFQQKGLLIRLSLSGRVGMEKTLYSLESLRGKLVKALEQAG
ncbi:hypothetical protein HYU90_00050 [Candidatus Collierbacteria bacterium]|nr:hypothetical protein [Candidatus Collierbacteria bacterium]